MICAWEPPPFDAAKVAREQAAAAAEEKDRLESQRAAASGAAGNRRRKKRSYKPTMKDVPLSVLWGQRAGLGPKAAAGAFLEAVTIAIAESKEHKELAGRAI